MKILVCGDVVGKSGRKIVLESLPKLKKELGIDFVVVNGENSAHGFGISPKIYQEFMTHDVDVITLGNHSFDKKEIFPVLESENNIIRPMNYPQNTIGKGACIVETSIGVRVAVVQLLGRVYMRSVDDPFMCISNWLSQHQRGKDYDILIVDFHAEATAEKVAMGHYLNGHASLIVGTHTHIPTADAHILSLGTGYMTDLGMCGDYDSVIGMQKEGALCRFCGQTKRLEPAQQNATFCAVFADIDEKSGKTREIFPVRLGDILEKTHEL